MIGVNPVPPSFPRLETVKVEPSRSVLRNFLSLAFSARLATDISISSTLSISVFFMTGTTRPISVSTATPILMNFFSIILFPSNNDELKIGNSFRALQIP